MPPNAPVGVTSEHDIDRSDTLAIKSGIPRIRRRLPQVIAIREPWGRYIGTFMIFVAAVLARILLDGASPRPASRP